MGGVTPEALAEALSEELERAGMYDIDIDQLLGVAEADWHCTDLRRVLEKVIARLERQRDEVSL